MCIFCYTIYNMRFKTLFTLSTSVVASAMLCWGGVKKHQKTPANAGKFSTVQTLEITSDTIRVTDSNFNHVSKTAAAGLFLPYENRVVVYHFEPMDTTARVVHFCDMNNQMKPLVQRHEVEHARKAIFTHQDELHSPYVRGQIAAMNEIIAPAAEIIEALDWRAKHGSRFPTLSNCLARADRDITRMADTLKMTWPLDFNRPEIATLVMKYALQKFQIEFNRGVYRTTIRRATESVSDKKYTPNDQCGFPYQDMLFCPESDMWAPMWSFNSLRGRVNPWVFADIDMRKKLLSDVEKCVETASNITGQKPPFLINAKMR